MQHALPTIFALLVGFLAGLLTFKVKTHWCGTCGSSLACVECRDRQAEANRRLEYASREARA